MLIQVLLSLCKLDVTICDLKIYAGVEKAFQLLPQKITTIKTKYPPVAAGLFFFVRLKANLLPFQFPANQV